MKLKQDNEISTEYLKVNKNDYGKPFLYYNREGNLRYRSWQPISEGFYNHLVELIKRNNCHDELKECLIAVRYDINTHGKVLSDTMKNVSEALSKTK